MNVEQILTQDERQEIVDILFNDAAYLYIVRDKIEKRLGGEYNSSTLIDEFIDILKKMADERVNK